MKISNELICIVLLLAVAHLASCGVVSEYLTPPSSTVYATGYGTPVQEVVQSVVGVPTVAQNQVAFAASSLGSASVPIQSVALQSGLNLAGINLNAGTTFSHQIQPIVIPIPQPVPIHIVRPIPVPVAVPTPVEVPRPVPVEVPQPVEVVVQKPYPVKIARPVPVPVKVPVHVKVPQPVKINVIKPYPVIIRRPVPVPVSTPVEVYTHGGGSVVSGLTGGLVSALKHGVTLGHGHYGSGHYSKISYSHGQAYDSHGGYKY